jgi:ketosteroid isomerase-like protein
MSDTRALTNAWNDAWNSREADKLADFFAEGSTYYEPGLGSDPIDGAAGIREAAEKTWQEWPEATFEAVSITVEGTRTVIEWRSNATHRSGAAVRLEGVDVLEWDGDKLESARVYYDEHSRRQQVGNS